MKYPNLFLRSLFFVLLLTPVVAHAEGIGIQFAKMPKGTQMFYVDHDGDKWREVFVGKRAGRYIVKIYAGHSPNGGHTRTDQYDAKGRLVQDSVGGQGLRFRYRPYKCDYALGACSYRKYQLGAAYVNNGSSETYQVTTRKKGNKYEAVWTRPNQSGSTVSTLTLTKYNLRALDQWGRNRFVKLVKVE